ncbi:MAG: cell division protein ZapB [Cyanobacteria bacterium P01_G01_bin.49]
MARNRKYKEASIFELMSDISLSTLGLFLVVFVIYALIFNSRSSVLINKSDHLEREVSRLNEDNQRLQQQNSELTSTNSQLMSEKNEAIENSQNSQNQVNRLRGELNALLKQNKYTGYYTGNFTSKMFFGGCNSDNFEIIEGEETIVYLPQLNLIVHSLKSKYGTLNYRYTGHINGNTFTIDSTEYSRTKQIEACEEKRSLVIKFEDDSLRLYYRSDDNSELVEDSILQKLE